MGSGANTPGRAGRPIEHPGRNLQPSPGCLTREAATENLSASLLNHLMNMDRASGPRMPRIKKLVLRDPVGVPSSCCTTASELIDPLTRMRRSLARYSAPVSFVHARSSVDFITTIVGLKVFGTHSSSIFWDTRSDGCIRRGPARRTWDTGHQRRASSTRWRKSTH